jgi:chromosomal replication initiation ATPase DnaA
MTSQAYIYPLLHSSSKSGIRIKAIHGCTYDRKAIANFIEFICKEKGIPVDEFLSTRRWRYLVEARQWVCYFYNLHLERTKTAKPPLRYIGEMIGGKDHATVLHSIKTTQALLDTNQAKNDEYNNLYLKYIKND